MSRVLLPAAIALAGLATLAVPAGAGALYGNAADDSEGAQLISAHYNRLEQGDDSTVYAAISADGRYVAIQTLSRNFFADEDPDPPGQYRKGGIFRFDLQTRALEKVADGDLYDEDDNTIVRRGAFNPSISADGRYVAFTTAQQLVAADANEHFDVYVRDMTIPIGQPGDFDLVSARDGGDEAALYGPPEEPIPGGQPGASAARGVAISADGSRVAFRTDALSNLPSSAGVDVPAGQVLIRDRDSDGTTLVTAKRDGGTGEMTELPAGGAISAAISADGTTVAWTGGNAAVQTRFLEGENTDPSFPYYLWRRVADGPDAPTRRITGLSDPDDPDCPPGATVFDQVTTGPCFGPLTDQEANRSGISDQPPAISGDGYTVAFVTGSGPRPLAFTGVGFDLYLTDMTPGLSRKEATVELTRDPATFDAATSSSLSAIAMSTGGRFVAVTTVRTKFTLPALQVIGETRPQPDVRELYVVDLENRTLERVAHSTDGGDIDGAVLDGATISGDGSRLAFVSFAGNLFFGDANQRADAFVATRRPTPEGGPPSDGRGETGPAGTIETDDGGPQIGAQAKSKAGGAVALTVSVPAAGSVKAVAKARAGVPRELRTLATDSARAGGPSRSAVRLLLRPVARYRVELRAREAIPGRALVSYVASRGGRRASVSLRIVFRQTVTPTKRTKGQRK